jgi:hypothetical protein
MAAASALSSPYVRRSKLLGPVGVWCSRRPRPCNQVLLLNLGRAPIGHLDKFHD